MKCRGFFSLFHESEDGKQLIRKEHSVDFDYDLFDPPGQKLRRAAMEALEQYRATGLSLDNWSEISSQP